MEASDIVHVQRGALLHDIGKMGVPDSILLKPGPLTTEERQQIEQHPVYAFELLAPIDFLRPALDIPYCHHEKWDGSGYPRGLTGEQIPLAARIFAIVDVFDALTSDRPYRAAWTGGDRRRRRRAVAGRPPSAARGAAQGPVRVTGSPHSSCHHSGSSLRCMSNQARTVCHHSTRLG
jgi:response regulator RpfG family c-di-GMP phosphodiesterase